MLWGIDKGGFFFLWAGELLFFFCVFERRYLSFSQLLLSLSGNFHRERRAWASISKLFYLPEWIFLCAFFPWEFFRVCGIFPPQDFWHGNWYLFQFLTGAISHSSPVPKFVTLRGWMFSAWENNKDWKDDAFHTRKIFYDSRQFTWKWQFFRSFISIVLI